MSTVTGLPNVGVHVRDAERSIAFYVGLLGFEIVRDSGWLADPVVLGMTATPMPLRIVNIRCGAGAALSIVQGRDVADEAPAREFHTPGAMHLAMDVDDVTDVLARLAAAGVPTVGPVGEVSNTGAGQAVMGFVRDPDGFFVQLIQR